MKKALCVLIAMNSKNLLLSASWFLSIAITWTLASKFSQMIRFKHIITFTFFTAYSLVYAETNTAVFDHDAGPQKSCQLSKAQFRLWIPDNNKKINGVIIVTPGRNGDGRRNVNNKDYQKLASKWGFAIMANFLHGTTKDKDTYQLDPRGNTANLLVDALEAFAEKTKHDELKSAPLFLFGTSAGGNVSVQFAGYYPKRTIGVVAYIPTVGPGMNGHKKLKVPMLVAVGAKDRPSWVNFSDSVWAKFGRRSFWTYAKHKELGHNGGQAANLGMTFAEAVLSQRLTEDNDGDFKEDLAKLTVKWTGDLSTYEIKEANSSRLGKDECWIPNEETAIAWKKYLTSTFGKK